MNTPTSEEMEAILSSKLETDPPGEYVELGENWELIAEIFYKVGFEAAEEIASEYVESESCEKNYSETGMDEFYLQEAQEPVATLHCGGLFGNDFEDWKIEQYLCQCDKLNEHYSAIGQEVSLALYTHPQPIMTGESSAKK